MYSKIKYSSRTEEISTTPTWPWISTPIRHRRDDGGLQLKEISKRNKATRHVTRTRVKTATVEVDDANAYPTAWENTV